MKHVLVDAGFLIALYDERDGNHAKANEYFMMWFEGSRNRLVVPWPIMYESVSTRMVRQQRRIGKLRRDWESFASQRRLLYLDDTPFRERALEECFAETDRSPGQYRALSLVDRVVRHILSDPHMRIDLFITFNVGDFADICQKSHCPIA